MQLTWHAGSAEHTDVTSRRSREFVDDIVERGICHGLLTSGGGWSVGLRSRVRRFESCRGHVVDVRCKTSARPNLHLGFGFLVFGGRLGPLESGGVTQVVRVREAASPKRCARRDHGAIVVEAPVDREYGERQLHRCRTRWPPLAIGRGRSRRGARGVRLRDRQPMARLPVGNQRLIRAIADIDGRRLAEASEERCWSPESPPRPGRQHGREAALFLLRHTKSSWADPHPRGSSIARSHPAAVAPQGASPTTSGSKLCVRSSCCARRRGGREETLAELTPVLGDQVEVVVTDDLYGANADEMLGQLRELVETLPQ